jgi:hypothetical protein
MATRPPIRPAARIAGRAAEAILNSSEVNNNTASYTSGAGIVNHGTMTLNKSEVNGNTAAGSGVFASGGRVINAQGPPGAANTAVLTLKNSRGQQQSRRWRRWRHRQRCALGWPGTGTSNRRTRYVEPESGHRQHGIPRRRHLQLRGNDHAEGYVYYQQ